VIPFVRCHKNVIKVMLVKDRRSGDYAFLSGGVKAHESIMRAAVRELHEETYGALKERDVLNSSCIRRLEFLNYFRPQHKDEDIELRKKYGQYYPNGVSECCHVVVFEVPSENLDRVLMSYQEAFSRLACNEAMLKHLETTHVMFEDIRVVCKWERDQMRGRNTSADANGVHLWDVHVKNGVALRVLTALDGVSSTASFGLSKPPPAVRHVLEGPTEVSHAVHHDGCCSVA
jgi:NUDIX domain